MDGLFGGREREAGIRPGQLFRQRGSQRRQRFCVFRRSGQIRQFLRIGSEVVKFFDLAASTDKTLKIYPGYYHDLLADIGKEDVMADIQNWIDERLPASTSTASGA